MRAKRGHQLQLILEIKITVLRTYISGDELLHVIDALDSDFALTDHVIVIRVGGDEQGLWKEFTVSTLALL